MATACEHLGPAGFDAVGGGEGGEVDLMISWRRDRIVVHLGEPVSWFTLSPQHARQIAASLAQHAHALDGRGPSLTALIEAY